MTAQQIQPALKINKTQDIDRVLLPYSAQKRAILIFLQDEMGHLEENWDGYGASSIEKNALDNSIFLIENTPNSLVNLLQKENILPNPNGTLSFEWVKEEQELFLEIGNNHATYYGKIKGKMTLVNNKFILSNLLEFRQFLRELKSCMD